MSLDHKAFPRPDGGNLSTFLIMLIISSMGSHPQSYSRLDSVEYDQADRAAW
jgi:hypothetical protein